MPGAAAGSRRRSPALASWVHAALAASLPHLAVSLAALGLAWAPVSMARDAPPWPTYNFEVQFGAGDLKDSLVNLFSGDEQAALAPQLAEIELYLSDAARTLQKLGFRAPPMARGTRGYIVRLYDYPDEFSYMQGGWVGDICVMRMDLSRVFVNGRMETRVMENAGHELFHCVQAAYPMFGLGVTNGSWITEATAQAIGQDLLWYLRGQEFPRSNPGQRWGVRPYHLPLALPDARMPEKRFHYFTESFWRYLAEHAAAKQRGGRAGVDPPEVDQLPAYAYLHELFLNPPSGPSEAAELTWADEGLAAIFGVGLDRLYPEFAATFAGYLPARFDSSRTPPKDLIERWTKIVFGDCLPITLDMDNPLRDVSLQLAPVASRCIRIESPIHEQADVTVHLHTESVLALRSLVAGTAGGDRVAQPVTLGPPAVGGLAGYWTFSLGLDKPQVLVVSNVFEDAALTRAQNVVLKISVNGWLSSATTPVPEKPAAASPPASASAAQKNAAAPARNATRESAAARVASGLDSLSAHSIGGLDVAFNPDEPPCAEPFALAACGPNTTINLSLVPGSVASFAQVSGTGGSLAQFLTTLSAVGDRGIAETNAGMEAAAQAIAETKGSTVNIVVPAIDYGFAGSLDNVLIHVNGEGGDELQAIGPQDLQPGPGRMFAQSGTVTIEEFTPFVLRGQFSAPVVNVSRVDWDNLEDDPLLPISEVVRGRFVIGAPWRGDPRTVMLQTEDVYELAKQDLAALMPVAVDIPEIAPTRPATVTDSSDGSGYSVQPVRPLPRCDCACGPLASLPPECRAICEPAVRHCVATRSLLDESGERIAQEAGMAAASQDLRERFDAHLMSTNADPMYRDAMLQAFDDMGSVREQRNFVRSMGMPLEQAAAEIDPNLERVLNMTREEYIAELEATQVPEALWPELLEIFDEYERRKKGK